MRDRDYIANPKGHVWKLDEDGNVDTFYLDYDFHNGPGCVKCGYTFCEHCDSEITECPIKE